MLRLLFLSCLPYLLLVHGKKENDTDLLHFIMREQASMIKHCMSNVCNRNMYNPNRPVGPWKTVAFSAYMSSSLSFSSSSRVVFRGTYTNIGNAYDKSTGIFTAPVDGVYAFQWTIMISSGRYAPFYIQVNGHNKQAMYGYANSYSNYYSPSQSYATHLYKGDKVNIFCAGSRGHVHATYSSFTGYRV